MVRADQGSGRPFTRTRWWWIRHAPVRAHGGRIYGQADLACDCSDEAVLQSVARVLPKGQSGSAAISVAPATPALRAVPAFAEQHLGEWQGLDRTSFAAERPAMAASYWYAPADERPPGGESFADVC